jgi:hypothetical protein
VGRTHGIDRARTFLHHDSGSKCFHRHFDLGAKDLDVFGIMVDEHEDLSNVLALQSSAVSRIETRTIDREMFLQKYVSEDGDVVAAGKE